MCQAPGTVGSVGPGPAPAPASAGHRVQSCRWKPLSLLRTDHVLMCTQGLCRKPRREISWLWAVLVEKHLAGPCEACAVSA